jgi:brefeldin A-resistance guanine nucleotide exchange factor 1
VRIWLNLFVNSLAPNFTLTVSGKLDIDPIPIQYPLQVIDKGARVTDTGLFSAFTSYISSYAADDPPEPSDEELEKTLCTVDAVTACHMDLLFTNIW